MKVTIDLDIDPLALEMQISVVRFFAQHTEIEGQRYRAALLNGAVDFLVEVAESVNQEILKGGE